MAWVNDVVDAQYHLDTVSKQQQVLPISSAFSKFPDNEVLRVFQVDALATQQEIVEILRAALYRIFDIQPLQSMRYAYQEELLLGLDLVLYRFSVWRLGQSIGDRLQNLVMRDEERARALGLQGSTSLIPCLAPHRRLLLVHAILSILVPYAMRKLQRKALEERWEDHHDLRRLTAKTLRYSFVLWSLLSLLNTLHFFATGQYRTLLERLLSIKMCYGSQKMERLTNLVFLNQHVMWQTWSSLLSVLRVGRYFNRLLHSMQSIMATNNVRSGPENVCCACHEIPTISQVSNCGHLYCFYCIKSRLLDGESGASFRCYKCGQAVHTYKPAP